MRGAQHMLTGTGTPRIGAGRLGGCPPSARRAAAVIGGLGGIVATGDLRFMTGTAIPMYGGIQFHQCWTPAQARRQRPCRAAART